MRAALLVVATLVALSACKKKDEGQSFAEGMRILCDAPSKVAGGGPASKATALADYVEQNVSNEEVRKLLDGLAGMDASAKRSAVLEATGRAGIEKCPLADLWLPTPPTDQPPPAEGAGAAEPGAEGAAAEQPEAEGAEPASETGAGN